MADEEGPISRRILMVRHGHYDRTIGDSNKTWQLSPLGRRQAVRAARRVGLLLDAAEGTFDGLYASPWPRAAQTAEIVARHLDLPTVRIKPYLTEAVAVVDGDHAAHRFFGLPLTSAEAAEHAHAQVDHVRERFFGPPQQSGIVVLFIHGNLIRYLVAHVLGLPYDAWATMDVAHCGLTEIRVYPSGFEALICFNETGHLPPSLITTA